MLWKVFFSVLAADIFLTSVIGILAWIDERKKIKKHKNEDNSNKIIENKLKSNEEEINKIIENGLIAKNTIITSEIAKNAIITSEDWVDWIPEEKYLKKGYYDYTEEFADIRQKIFKKIPNSYEYEPLLDYAKNEKSEPIELKDIRDMVIEMQMLAVVMKHHGATDLELLGVCNFYRVLLRCVIFELDWERAYHEFGIKTLGEKYFPKVYLIN